MRYQVRLAGDAWAELTVEVEAEDEREAVRKALMSGAWRIVGDVKVAHSHASREHDE